MTDNVMLSPIDGRPLSPTWQAAYKAGIRKCYRAGNDTLENPVWAMHRMQVGSRTYVGSSSSTRIAILYGKLLYNPDLRRCKNARIAKRIKKAITELFQESKKSSGKRERYQKNQISSVW